MQLDHRHLGQHAQAGSLGCPHDRDVPVVHAAHAAPSSRKTGSFHSPRGSKPTVTGASSGIGRETAILLARDGVKVMASARREDRLRGLRDELAAENLALEYHAADAADPAAMEELARVTRERLGEIDIIARDGKTLVFVEVKTRTSDEPTPEDQVHSFKQQQITRAAKFYLSRYGTQPPARFDVVAIVWPTGRDPQIRHTQSAFEATAAS